MPSKLMCCGKNVVLRKAPDPEGFLAWNGKCRNCGTWYCESGHRSTPEFSVWVDRWDEATRTMRRLRICTEGECGQRRELFYRRFRYQRSLEDLLLCAEDRQALLCLAQSKLDGLPSDHWKVAPLRDFLGDFARRPNLTRDDVRRYSSPWARRDRVRAQQRRR